MALKPIPVGTRPQLFVDDFLVAERNAVAERLHPMTRLPTPVLTAEAPWERPDVGGLWGPVTALYDPDEQLFKLWYNSMGIYPAGGPRRDPTYHCYATSPDGIHWERPNLGLVEHAGSAANNIFAVGGDPSPATGHGMLDCPEMAAVEPADRRYKAVGWTGPGADGLGTVGASFSPDGLRWRSYEGNPVLSGSLVDDTNSAAKLRESAEPSGLPGAPTAKYALVPRIMAQLGQWRRRCIGICTSEDDRAGSPFAQWSEPLLALAPDHRDDQMAEERLAAAKPLLLHDHPDDHHCEFYGMLLFPYGDLFFGLVWVYDAAFDIKRLGRGNEYAIVDVQLVSSRDLIHWHRVGSRQPVIGRGEPGTFDSHMIFYHSLPVTVGDEWWVYYVGFNEGHAAKACYDEPMRQQYHADVKAGRRHFPAVGLAKVRREGYVSLDASAAGGTVTTRPLQPGGSQLELNAAVAPAGAITVEVQDANGQSLPGFEAAACAPVQGDSLRHQVRWADQRGDERWLERSVCLKFHLREAALYGFRFAEGDG